MQLWGVVIVVVHSYTIAIYQLYTTYTYTIAYVCIYINIYIIRTQYT